MRYYSAMADEVSAVCPDVSPDDILIDLRKTNSTLNTINRIFDGSFLEGTSKDPSLHVAQAAKPLMYDKKQLDISSDEEMPTIIPKKRKLSPRSLEVIDLISDEEPTGYRRRLGSQGSVASSAFQSSQISTLKTSLQNVISMDISCSKGDEDFFGNLNKKATKTTIASSLTRRYSFESSDDEILNAFYPRKQQSTQSFDKLDLKISDEDTAPTKNPDLNTDASSDEDLNDAELIKQPIRKKKRTPEEIEADKLEKEEKKRLKAEERARLKEEKKRMKEDEKRSAKAAKEAEKNGERPTKKFAAPKNNGKPVAKEVLEKRVMKAANKLRTKTETMQEMIIEFDSVYRDGPNRIAPTVVEDLGAEILTKRLPIPNSILFVRKVNRRWSDLTKSWNPCEETLEYEKYILVLINADDFAMKIATRKLKNFIVKDIKEKYDGYEVILLIEGLGNYHKKQKREINKHFQASMLKDTPIVYEIDDMPDAQTVQVTLMELQFEQKIHVQCAKDADESAEWIGSIAKEIAVIPEQSRRSNHAFNLNFGDKPASGKDLTDTWKKMLMQYFSVSPEKADAIVRVYPTINKLYTAYSKCGSKKACEEMLCGIEVTNAARTKVTRMGPAISKRVYEGFMGDDPDEIMRK